jgi:hypothetical protein
MVSYDKTPLLYFCLIGKSPFMNEIIDLYLESLKDQLTDFKLESYTYYTPVKQDIPEEVKAILVKHKMEPLVLCEAKKYDPLTRAMGKDWPQHGETMLGQLRINNLKDLALIIKEEDLDGDFFEAGVWRGGASIFLNALNKVYFNSTKKVWVADSFQGLPPSTHEKDLSYDFTQYEELSVSLEKVKENFDKYQLLDKQVVFLKGWFKDTLPSAKVEKIALLRLDGDLYESTMDILNNLYDKVVPGGYIVVDDYALQCCKDAISDFRKERGITAEITPIDWTGVYWKKE